MFARWRILRRTLKGAIGLMAAVWAAVAVSSLCAAQPKFPLKISENRRYLVDQESRPFFLVGDAAWSLIVQLNLKEVDRYLDARRKLGFNALLVNLIEHHFADAAPRNKAGAAPFRKADDLATPNEAYFKFADAVIEHAEARGFCVLLVPAYLGYGGGAQGWFRPIKRGGREKLRAYGRFVGRRYRDQPNIIWVMGGDFTPAKNDRWTADELAAGIREAGAAQLMTYHGSPGRSPADDFGGRDWLDLNNTYSYGANLHADTLADYRRKTVQPTFLMESAYENEHNASAQRIRRQAWWAVATGACGHIYGNNPMWSFGAPNRLFRQNNTWQGELNSQGAKDMGRLAGFLADSPWHRLVPDADRKFLVAGQGNAGSAAYSTAAITRQGDWAMVYVAAEAPREFTLDLESLSGEVHARWFNPAEGTFGDASEAPLPNRGRKAFAAPGKRGSDWVLVLDAARAKN